MEVKLRKKDLSFCESTECWVYNTEYCEYSISADLEEFEIYYNDTDEYFSGSLIYDDEHKKMLIDYDGVYELPEEIYAMLKALRVDLSEMIF